METRILQLGCHKCKKKIPGVLFLAEYINTTEGDNGTVYQIDRNGVLISVFLCEECAEMRGDQNDGNG